MITAVDTSVILDALTDDPQFGAASEAVLAGEYFAHYLARAGQAKRALPDFLIGAHAVNAADRLLARDRRYVRDYFKSTDLWDASRERCTDVNNT